MLQDDIRSHWPLWKRLGDSLTGGSLSEATVDLVAASRLSELDSRQRVMRRAAELQAALYERAEQIGSPPPLESADVDALVYAAIPEIASRPDESADPKGYYGWTVAFAERSMLAASQAYEARLAVVRGLWDECLKEGLDADLFVDTLKDLDALAPDRPRLPTIAELPVTHSPGPEPDAGIEH